MRKLLVLASVITVASAASAGFLDSLGRALLRGAGETLGDGIEEWAKTGGGKKSNDIDSSYYQKKEAEEKRAEEERKAREREERLKEEARQREEARIRRIESFAKERLAKVWSAYESIDKTEKTLSDLRATLVQFDFKPGTDPDYMAAKRICDELKNDKKTIWTSIENAYITDQRYLALPDVEESVNARDKAFSESNLLAETVLAKIRKFKEGV